MNEILTLTLMMLGDLNQSQIRQRKHDQESNQEPDRDTPGIPLRSWSGSIGNPGNGFNRAVEIPDGATIHYFHI